MLIARNSSCHRAIRTDWDETDFSFELPALYFVFLNLRETKRTALIESRHWIKAGFASECNGATWCRDLLTSITLEKMCAQGREQEIQIGYIGWLYRLYSWHRKLLFPRIFNFFILLQSLHWQASWISYVEYHHCLQEKESFFTHRHVHTSAKDRVLQLLAAHRG